MVPDIDADGCRLSWAAQGPADAPALLLLNALGTTVDLWQAQIAPFAAAFRVIRFDTRGHRSVRRAGRPYASTGLDATPSPSSTPPAPGGPTSAESPSADRSPSGSRCTRQNE